MGRVLLCIVLGLNVASGVIVNRREGAHAHTKSRLSLRDAVVRSLKTEASVNSTAAQSVISSLKNWFNGNSMNEVEEAAASRMRYWSPAGEQQQPVDTYLLFDYDRGGLNNIRMGWEYSGLIAKMTGRTLVLPPPKSMYLLDYGPRNKKYVPKFMEIATRKKKTNTITAMEDLVNMKQLRGNLPVLTAAEFEQKMWPLTWQQAKDQAGTLKDGRMVHNLDQKALDCNNVPEYMSIKHKFLMVRALNGHREGFMCGEWWKQGGPKDTLKRHMGDAHWALLQHGFVWHEDAFNIAAKAVSYLGLFNYVAIHARYGDFVEKKAQQGPKEILQHWKEYLPEGATLYIATDEPGKFQGHAAEGVRLLVWDDFFQSSTGNLLAETQKKYSGERWFKLLGLVEELICTYSKIFVGTARSTFTGHIQRMRIQAGAPSIVPINHKDGITQKANTPDDFPQVRDDLEQWDLGKNAFTWKPLDMKHGSIFIETESSESQSE
jgi:hypothetical protein